MSNELEEGAGTLLTFAAAPTIKLRVKTVKPPGMDFGGKIDMTGLSNTKMRTFAPKKFCTMTDPTATCFYNPLVYNDILSVGGQNQLITATFSDGTSLPFYGWIDKFEPQEVKEGDAPLASVTICSSNRDGSKAENQPVAA